MKYRHFKGGLYEFICEARLEPDPTVTMIVYRSLADNTIWTHPKTAFFETVEHEGKTVPRFAPVTDALLGAVPASNHIPAQQYPDKAHLLE